MTKKKVEEKILPLTAGNAKLRTIPTARRYSESTKKITGWWKTSHDYDCNMASICGKPLSPWTRYVFSQLYENGSVNSYGILWQ